MVGVSFAHWSGPTARGCDSAPTNGLKLLTKAGFTVAGTSSYGLAFLCRIGSPLFNSGTQYPTPAQDRCVSTPPSTAYWSYWLAAKGSNTWTFSASGASSHTATNGEVEAWAFGAGAKPPFTPNSIRSGLPVQSR